MPSTADAGKRGYLRENFRFVRLKDSRAQQIGYHYHEFDKVILLLGGKVTYVVEGVTYFLRPWDLLLVPHDRIHRPIIDPSEPYERVVLWLGQDWLRQRSAEEAPLDACLQEAVRRNFHLLRILPADRPAYLQLFQSLESALRSEDFGHRQMADLLCQQLLLTLSRDMLRSQRETHRESYRLDPKMDEILQYIAAHLAEDLSVDGLAGRFYLSRYYLMHRFKAVTGYSLHQYITQKRLLWAGELLRQGTPVMKAAELAGFRDYSTFLRAFQSTFHVSPRQFLQGPPPAPVRDID